MTTTWRASACFAFNAQRSRMVLDGQVGQCPTLSAANDQDGELAFHYTVDKLCGQR